MTIENSINMRIKKVNTLVIGSFTRTVFWYAVKNLVYEKIYLIILVAIKIVCTELFAFSFLLETVRNTINIQFR